MPRSERPLFLALLTAEFFAVPEWVEHCPIGEDDHPVKRKAWRDGWRYCMAHGPSVPAWEGSDEQAGRPALLMTWLHGYSVADRVRRSS